MGANLPTHYTSQYTRNVALLVQQRGSKLRGTVTEPPSPYEGDRAYPVNQIGSFNALRVTGRFGDMPRVDPPTDRRQVTPQPYDLPMLIDPIDLQYQMTNPQSEYAIGASYAMGRAIDDEIIAAFDGTANTGVSGGTSTSLPSGQTVAVDLGAAADTGLNVAKLLRARKILEENEVDLDFEPVFCMINALQKENLLKEAEVVSADYNAPVLRNGKLESYLGINFIMCERFLTDSNSDQRIPVWVPSGMHLGIWDEINASISIRNDLRSEPVQIYLKGNFGSTRIEEEKVVQILCDPN